LFNNPKQNHPVDSIKILATNANMIYGYSSIGDWKFTPKFSFNTSFCC